MSLEMSVFHGACGEVSSLREVELAARMRCTYWTLWQLLPDVSGEVCFVSARWKGEVFVSDDLHAVPVAASDRGTDWSRETASHCVGQPIISLRVRECT